MKAYLHRHLPPITIATVLKAGFGGGVGIAIVALLSDASGVLWLMAPFGATCVLLFSVPASPLSQPVNVVGGHVVSTLIGLIVLAMLPVTWWSMALAVGLAIAAMAALRITHPPAGADPLVVMAAGVGFDFLLFPTLTGAVALVAVAAVVHRIAPKTPYPLQP
ncbi:HPP family protein [Magnetovibrio sp.]|uniref:HPP family protein n=1 Tax=Magnetovibrio sp. TaxID=2024836 RepID=UPI002F938703